MTTQPVFRFAPSPNGHLHLGNAYSALLNADMARRMGGRFLIRIEDIDTLRCPDILVEGCLEDLAWLGLVWEQPVLRQSEHFPRYRAVAADLEARGLAYPCFCTRSAIAKSAGASVQRDPDGVPRYPGTCRGLDKAEAEARKAAGEAFALRLDIEKALRAIGPDPLPGQAFEVDPLNWGDVVLVRKDYPTSYHLSVVLDDALQGVTHVVRGEDLLAATAIHRVLQCLLGLPAPLYHHHELLIGEDGKKYAKSSASKPLWELRAAGVTPEIIRRRLGFG